VVGAIEITDDDDDGDAHADAVLTVRWKAFTP